MGGAEAFGPAKNGLSGSQTHAFTQAQEKVTASDVFLMDGWLLGNSRGYGCGCGSVKTLNVPSSPREEQMNASPWAVKKINSKCESKQAAVYQNRLKEEARLLRGIDHPNIIGKEAIDGQTWGGGLTTGCSCTVCSLCRFSRRGHRQRRLRVFGDGVRRGAVTQRPHRAEEGAGSQGLPRRQHREGGPACGARPAGETPPPFFCVLLQNFTISLFQYLHNEKKLLHGDMKSCNVVIKGDFESVKICDVGVSLQLDENMTGELSSLSMFSRTQVDLRQLASPCGSRLCKLTTVNKYLFYGLHVSGVNGRSFIRNEGAPLLKQ